VENIARHLAGHIQHPAMGFNAVRATAVMAKILNPTKP
jgi:hypothetical protein